MYPDNVMYSMLIHLEIVNVFICLDNVTVNILIYLDGVFFNVLIY